MRFTKRERTPALHSLATNRRFQPDSHRSAAHCRAGLNRSQGQVDAVVGPADLALFDEAARAQGVEILGGGQARE